jgi:hypothetical protein
MNDYQYLKEHFPRLRKKTVYALHKLLDTGYRIIRTNDVAKNKKLPALIKNITQ